MDSGGAEVLLPVACGHGQAAAMDDACGRARQPCSLLCLGPSSTIGLYKCQDKSEIWRGEWLGAGGVHVLVYFLP